MACGPLSHVGSRAADTAGTPGRFPSRVRSGLGYILLDFVYGQRCGCRVAFRVYGGEFVGVVELVSGVGEEDQDARLIGFFQDFAHGIIGVVLLTGRHDEVARTPAWRPRLLTPHDPPSLALS
ncbi:hypothetical protein ABE83_00040 [Streptomyces sp. CFMR 7]|nr:hypothetical protein ABE83_00040 [Streptomyces sp. CFMR 7]